MADTTPLPKIGSRKNFPKSVETNDLAKHYMIYQNGLYGSHEYADISLILKNRKTGLS